MNTMHINVNGFNIPVNVSNNSNHSKEECTLCGGICAVVWNTYSETPIVDEFCFTGILCMKCNDDIAAAKAGDEEALVKLKLAML